MAVLHERSHHYIIGIDSTHHEMVMNNVKFCQACHPGGTQSARCNLQLLDADQGGRGLPAKAVGEGGQPIAVQSQDANVGQLAWRVFTTHWSKCMHVWVYNNHEVCFVPKLAHFGNFCQNLIWTNAVLGIDLEENVALGMGM